MTLSSDSIEVTHERVSQSYGNTIKVVSLKGARTLSFPWTMSAYSSVVKQLCKVCTAFLRQQLRGDFTKDRFFSNRRDLYQIVSGESFFWSARLSSRIASKKWSATVFKHVEQYRSKTVFPWSSWSSEDLVSVGCLHCVDTTHDPR